MSRSGYAETGETCSFLWLGGEGPLRCLRRRAYLDDEFVAAGTASAACGPGIEDLCRAGNHKVQVALFHDLQTRLEEVEEAVTDARKLRCQPSQQRYGAKGREAKVELRAELIGGRVGDSA